MTTRPELEAQARKEAEEKYPAPDYPYDNVPLTNYTTWQERDRVQYHKREAWASARLDHLVDIEGRAPIVPFTVEGPYLVNPHNAQRDDYVVEGPTKDNWPEFHDFTRAMTMADMLNMAWVAGRRSLPPTPDEGEVRAMANTWVGTEHGTHKLEDILTAFALHVLNTPRS